MLHPALVVERLSLYVEGFGVLPLALQDAVGLLLIGFFTQKMY